MSDMKHLRKKLMINHDVQGAIICRTILHWFFYLSAILLTVVICQVVQDPSQNAMKLVYQSFVYFAPAVIASIILLPLMIYDTLRETNRVAGPIFRLKREMQTLTAGNNVRNLRFRDGDHWFDMAETFNCLAHAYQARQEEIESLKAALADSESVTN